MLWVVNATSYGYPPGGAGLRARHLFGAVRGAELLFLLAEDTPPEVVPPGAAVRRLPVRAAHPLRRFLRLSIPPEGDCFFTDHYPVAAPPTILTLHDRGGGLLRKRMIRRGIRRAAAVVAVSETVRLAWGCPAEVIPNGVEIPAGVCPSPEGATRLLLCDPGVPHKGAEIARAAARSLGMDLLEVGRGVGWLPRAELLGRIAGAAAVLCPSTEEGFGMVPLEAMALGRPVVLSDLPAHREVCGEVAFYAPPGDARAFAAAVAQALRCAPERLDRGRARAAEFTWEASARRLEVLVRSLRPGCRPGRG